jgi:alcohol dehydrogenase class IV
MIQPFSLARVPRIEFGPGAIARLPALAVQYGTRALLVTGARSLQASAHWEQLQAGLKQAGLDWLHTTIHTEPSPQMIDAAVKAHASDGIDVVIAIGGGSVLDAAKAIAGLLRVGDTVMDYLEGVGPEKPYRGPAVPFIAAPTTAGTGSEATKNAVLSVIGEGGFKKSFRDEQLVPEWAVVDPDLLATCPREQIAANGMDALTQLIESYVSLRANRLTDALAIDGIRAARDALLSLYDDPAAAAAARAGMAYAALLSGITLAQTGLGSVHGLASPLGAFFPIPHGMVCGTLVATCSRVNIEAMLERDPGNVALDKYTEVAEVLCRQTFSNRHAAFAALTGLLEEWTGHLQIHRLAHYGIGETDFERIVANCRGSSMKTNPVVLTDAEIGAILRERL